MQNRAFKLEIKSISDQGIFKGLASVYGNVDLGGDVVEPGAFARTLAHKGRRSQSCFRTTRGSQSGSANSPTRRAAWQLKASLSWKRRRREKFMP